MARIILHIGTHKTGTTGLQRSLFAQRDILRENGICYDPWPGVLSGLKYAHHGLAHRLARFDNDDQKVLANYRLRLEQALTREQDVIISAEPFYRHVAAGMEDDPEGARAKFLDRTADYFSGLPVEVSVCFRRPDRMAESMFKEQSVSTNNSIDFLPWLKKFSMRFDYSIRIKEFEERFGSIKVWCFEDATANGLVTSFLGQHGLEISALSEAERDRKSVSTRAAMWLLRTKQSRKGLSVSERHIRWYYAASKHAHPILSHQSSESLWLDAQSRNRFLDAALVNCRCADFWREPTDEPKQVSWTTEDQNLVTTHYHRWLMRNQVLLKMRKSARLSPYDDDSKIPLKTRLWYLPRQIKERFRSRD